MVQMLQCSLIIPTSINLCTMIKRQLKALISTPKVKLLVCVVHRSCKSSANTFFPQLLTLLSQQKTDPTICQFFKDLHR